MSRHFGADWRVLSFLVREMLITSVQDAAGNLEPLSEPVEFSDELAVPQPDQMVDPGLLLEEMPTTLLLPIDDCSRVDLIGEAVGFFNDGWVCPRAQFRCRAFDRIDRMILQVWTPPGPDPVTVTYTDERGDQVTLPATRDVVAILHFPLNVQASQEFDVTLTASRQQWLGDDDPRSASYILQSILFETG